ncbi:PTS sugar transporter subunit IIA [Oceanivirga miroungae]|uniref:PTS transporter subunit IIA-like nitrogen-regulatory protein PtsN n=1 Tax=Oceanivirga miroungae TaxID=1130046 RepID=A0A6I8M824_9FUSO|nr:PTS sugar transporter subunit IIA [Oceanivirga miroungae]VWL85579.1 PTS transporter subunit IIA-like nitrogen-regulatory protein PtsN [Oceanivirga miroungae]
MTREELIILDIDVKDKLHLFEKVSKKAYELKLVSNEAKLIEDFYDREKSFETYLDNECAVPHVRTENVLESCIFFIRLKKPIKWSDEAKAQEIFAILAKDDEADYHIDMLMNVSKKIMRKEYLDVLKKSKDVKKIVEIINK